MPTPVPWPTKSRFAVARTGNLRVWWVPQIPMKRFFARVSTLVEAKVVLETLAQYDRFQLDHNVKPDYANAGGLEMFDEEDKENGEGGSWSEWYDDDDGRGIGAMTLGELREREAKTIQGA